MRRLLLLIAGSLILIAVAVPAAALYFLICTESGFQFLISKVPARIGNVELLIRGPSGTLVRGLRIAQLDIDQPLVHLTIKGAQGRVELLPLLLQTVRTRGASIDSVFIQAKRRTRPPEPARPAFLPRWLIVNADHLRLGNATLVALNGSQLAATDLYASAMIRHRRIRFFEAGMRMGDTQLAASGELRARNPLGLDLQGRIGWAPHSQPPWSAAVTAKGDLSTLQVSAHTSAPFRADFTGQVLDLTSRWHWRGNAIVHDLDVAAWGLRADALGILSGQLAAQGNALGFVARGPVEPAGLKAGVFDVSFEGTYANHMLWGKHVEITHRGSGASVAAGGTLAAVPNGPQLALHGSWRDFRWPLTGKAAPFRSASGDFTLQGTWPYAVHAQGIAQVRDLPAMPTAIEGALGKDRFTFARGDVELYEGHAALAGEVVWAAPGSWSLSGRIADVNPAAIRADLPGKLSFDLSTHGQGFSRPGAGDLLVDIRDVSGRLRGVPASGGGRVVRTGPRWEFDRLRLALGGTSLALDGHVDGELDLRFAVSTRDLSLLSPESRGQLEAGGTIRGTLQSPRIVATARGTGIQHAGVALAQLDTEINFDASPQYDSRMEARIRDLVYHDRKLDSLSLRLSGRSTNYAVRLDARALGLALSVQASGPLVPAAGKAQPGASASLLEGSWLGQLTSLDFIGTESVRLKLQHPVAVLLSAARFQTQRLCLVGQPSSMCAEGEWTPGAWNATFTASEMPLTTFTAGWTQAVEYGGQINFSAHLSGGGQDPVLGSLRAELADATLSHRLSSGRIDHAKIGSGLVTVNANRATISAAVGLESGDVGTIQGKLLAQRSSDGWQGMPVQGELHAHTEQLGLITLYVPEIDRAAGHLDADMKITGTLGTPLTDGRLKIADGEIDYYQVNLGLRQLAFDAVLTDRGVDFKGSTRIGSGLADAKGHLEWRNSLPYGKVEVQGTDLRVVDVPEAQIDASPALEFDIDGRRIEAHGAVKVPYAKIVPTDLTGAVLASSDEVIVGQEQTDPSKRFEVVSSITLSLLDRVSIDTSGLTGRLTGNITVRSGYDKATTATGELSILQGKYTAYARKLDIQRGRLIFTGGPIDNPGIDIRAIKEFPDVTAGINVRGTLLQPRLSFFSDPSLTQSQIVSLILAGGSLESAQTRQGSEVLAQGGAILAQQLGSKVGIEDVSLESDLTNQTSLVLGRYLSPRLYVSYGVAITEQLNVLKLRYSLGDRWTVKTEVGQARGADLVYTIQR